MGRQPKDNEKNSLNKIDLCIGYSFFFSSVKNQRFGEFSLHGFKGVIEGEKYIL